MKSLSLVIPAYNEEENMPLLSEALRNAIPQITDDFEVVIIDDASTDDTPVILERLTRDDRHIRVVRNDRNRKLGGSLKEGFKRAQKELILYFDADLPFELTYIRKAAEIMEKEGADIVSAYRTNRDEGLRRALYSLVYNKMIKFIFGLGVKDINFSFKLFKKKVLQEIKPVSEGSFICAELLIRGRLKGFKISQFPVRYSPRKKGTSRLSRLPVIIKILWELAGFYFGFFIWQRKEGQALA